MQYNLKIKKSPGIKGKCKLITVTVSLMMLCGCALFQAKNNASIGMQYYFNNNYNKSVKYFEKAVKQDPKNKEYIIMLGWSYFKDENYDKAVDTFEELGVLYPHETDAYVGRGWSYFKKLDFDKAISFFEEAIRIDSGLSDSYTGLGWCNLRKGDLDEAEKYFNIALKKGIKYKKNNPASKTDPEAHRGLAYLNFNRGKYKAAIKHLKIAIALRPDWNDVRTIWGDCLFFLKKYKDAIAIYSRALEYTKTAQIYDAIGWCYIYLGDESSIASVKYRNYNRAHGMFNNALMIYPDFASSLSGLRAVEDKMSSDLKD